MEPIARAQVTLEDAADARRRLGGRRLVVRDTDLVSTVVYARHYYGAGPAWVVDAARARRADLYLLLSPDGAPWTPDPVRDTDAARAALLPAFRETLLALGCRYVELDGDWAARERRARVLVEELLAGRAPPR